MTGHDYLLRIKKELEAGRWQHKKGTSILAAFGYSRRRKAALAAINKEMKRLGLRADPPINENMPLDSSHIRFCLTGQTTTPRIHEETPSDQGTEASEPTEADLLPIPTFKVHDLSAAKPVECIKANEKLSKAYTVMLRHKYSQLVVADTQRPLATAIKGTITYKSIARALIHGPASTVIECLDKTTPQVSVDDDIDKVISNLANHDVVLVIGEDKRLAGIVTAWDLV